MQNTKLELDIIDLKNIKKCIIKEVNHLEHNQTAINYKNYLLNIVYKIDYTLKKNKKAKM